MNCEEFEKVGLDRERLPLGAAERAAAQEHAERCSRCAALQDSWAAASEELRLYAFRTAETKPSLRVEMRLRQEFYTKHHTARLRRVAGWLTASLATAAVIVGMVAWHDWHVALKSAQENHGGTGNGNASRNSAGASNEDATENLSASAAEESEFLPLPGSLSPEPGDASVVRVRMQRATLSAWGLPVNEDRAGEWIQVDLLVADDGQPQGVRLSP